MTRTAESPGGLVRRARISSAGARFPSAKTAFMISRSRRVSDVESALGIGILCDRCSIQRQLSHVKPRDGRKASTDNRPLCARAERPPAQVAFEERPRLLNKNVVKRRAIQAGLGD